MGVVAGIGAAAAASSLASSVSGMASGGSGPTGTYGGSPATYVPTNQPGFDQYYQQVVGSQMPYATSLPGAVAPGWSTYLDNVQNNPYAGYAQTASMDAANLSNLWSQTAGDRGTSLVQLGDQAAPYAGQLLQTGFDPRQQLYDRTANQLQQQLAATNAASGVFGPQAAQTTGQTLSNFNIDWQNQQLQRQLSAGQGYTGMLQGIGQDYAGGVGLGQTAIGLKQQYGQLPYQTYRGLQGDLATGLGNYTQGMTSALAPGNQVISNLTPYMQLGQNASALAQSGQQQQFAQNQAYMQQLGSGLAGLGNLYSKSQEPSQPSVRQVEDWFTPGGAPNYGVANEGDYYDPTAA